MTKPLTGQCLCGGIAYEIQGKLGKVVNCHCTKCRRWHGAAFRTRAAVEKKNFKWVRGEELLSRYNSSEFVTKTFCSICGSALISELAKYPDYIGLPIGGLDQDPMTKPSMNVYVAYKSPWYEICDGLPQYDEDPPGGLEYIQTTME